MQILDSQPIEIGEWLGKRLKGGALIDHEEV